MLPGWPQCTSQPGRSHVFTSSTNGANTAVTGSAAQNGRRKEPKRQQRRPPRTQAVARPYLPAAARRAVEGRAPASRAACRKARLVPGVRLQLCTWGWKWPAAGARTRRTGWQDRARPEQQRARHRRHHPSCHSTYCRVERRGKGMWGAWRGDSRAK